MNVDADNFVAIAARAAEMIAINAQAFAFSYSISKALKNHSPVWGKNNARPSKLIKLARS